MNPSFHNWAADRRLKGLVLIVLVLTAMALLSYTYLSLKQGKYVYSGPTTISVRGVGEVTKIPDVATFSFGVHTEAEDPAVAQQQSAEVANAIIAYLREGDIAETDIKTLNYSLSPRYEYSNTLCRAEFCPPQRSEIVGYSVDQTIQVKVRDTAKAGSLIVGAGERGATDVSSLEFTIDDETDAKAEARAEAVADAKRKARELADTLGVRIVRLTGFWEEEGGGEYPMLSAKAYGGDMMNADTVAVAPEVPSGENMITATVNLTYEIR